MTTTDAVNWNDMEWENVRPGIRRKVFHGEGCTVAYNEVRPGHEPKPHSHDYEQIAYIASGTAIYTVGEKAFEMTPGSIVRVPPLAEHFIMATGTEPCVNIDIFTPRRTDYRQSPIKQTR
ncbi:MAG: cupin domain-containing protein [Deltaproteobacteria bacterium]|nr:cupin domain-containing protein [Deltaproteobacteria bacterium]